MEHWKKSNTLILEKLSKKHVKGYHIYKEDIKLYIIQIYQDLRIQ
jgi:hypothetical protein